MQTSAEDGSHGHARARIAFGAALVVALVLAASGTAQAARPSVSTGAARNIGYNSALLTGALKPNGSDTSYYFQYGPTRAYGLQSAIADAGSGTATVAVSLPVSGLQPITEYHFRLVAVNAAGAQPGVDHAFLTHKIPLSLAILASPNPVPFGGNAIVQGTLSGTDNANKAVMLQGDAFPFTSGFQNLAGPVPTNASGAFSFTLLGLTTVTQLRVSTLTSAPVISPVTVESVAVRVSSHVGHARRPHHARIYGTVTPAEPGMQVAILRIAHGRGVLVGGTTLQPGNATSSRFSRVVPVHAGVYRVLVRVTSGAQISSYGQPLVIG